jgi:hypothetical protein
VSAALTIVGFLVALGDVSLVVACWRSRTVLGGVLGGSGFVLAVLTLLRGDAHGGYLILIAAVLLAVGTAVYFIGQAVDRLLQDAPDDA